MNNTDKGDAVAKVLSVHVGRAKTYGDANAKAFLEKEWRTASFKEAVTKPLHVKREGLEGDEVADVVHHGGLDKAIFANSYENYAHWASFLGLETLPYGALAENLTITGLHERSVTLGEIHQIGTAIVQVSQPRKPCWKISRRWDHTAFTQEIFTSGLSGWYYKVLQEGMITREDDVRVLEQERVAISILEANEAFRNPTLHQDVLNAILDISSLSSTYHESIRKRLSGESDLGYMQTKA